MSTVAKSRQLNLDELLRLKWLLGGALALVSLWTVFFLDIEALGLVGVAGAAIIAVMIWPKLPGRVPPVVWKLAVPAIIVAFAADLYFSPDTLPALIRLAILLVCYRAVGYRHKREDLQLLVLGLFLIVVAGVLTVSLGFAFLLLLFTACALVFLFVINLIEASETGVARTAEAETAWTRLGWRSLLARLRAVVDWRLMLFATVLFTAVVAMSGLLFLVIPRFEVASGFFLDRYITRKSRTGFTDTVKFGDVTELLRDESVAMRVDLTDASGIREDPYWRLVVLDEYGPAGFKVSAGLKAELIRGQRTTQQLRGRPLGRNVKEVGGQWTFYVEPGVSRFLPLPGSYGVLRMRDPVPLQTSPGNRLVALRTEPMTMSAFQLESVELTPTLTDARFPLLLRQAQSEAPGRNESFRYDPRLTLKGPEGPANEAILRRLLAEITGGAELSAEEFSSRVTDWLAARHAYALSVKIPKGEGTDDIVRWLDSNEPGFCEYFAAGFAVLARAAGHPTRVVVGFRGGQLNAFENYFMVKNSNAHAWTEIYDGRAAWLRTDPTPGRGSGSFRIQADGTQQEQDSSWSARVDSLRVLWYRRIVNFDSRQQVRMIEQVKSFTTDSGATMRARLEGISRRLKEWFNRPWDAARVVRSLGQGAGVVAFGWLLWRVTGLGWQRWRFWRRPAEFDPVRRTAGVWLGRLRRRTGIQPSPKPRPAGHEQEIESVIGDLQRLRYGRRETWPESGAVFRRARQARRTQRR
jgi:transglutaminase-like putative cysteine protease